MRWIITTLLVISAFTLEAGNNQWTTRGPFGADVLSFTFHPQKDNVIFANTGQGPYRSTNSGKTWQRLEVFGIVEIHPKNPERLIAISFSIFESFNEGDSWSLVTSNPFPPIAGSINDVVFDPSDPSILYGLSANGATGAGVFKSTDGGATWVRKSKGLPPEAGFHLVIDPKNGDVLYASIGRTGIFKTVNGGTSWKRVRVCAKITWHFAALGLLFFTPSLTRCDVNQRLFRENLKGSSIIANSSFNGSNSGSL